MCKGDAKAVHQTLDKAYADEPFLQVLPFGALPSTRDIARVQFLPSGGDRRPDPRAGGGGGGAGQPDQGILGSGDPERQSDAGICRRPTGLMLAPVFP